MVGRFLLKVIIFALIILYFILYQYNNEANKGAQDKVAHLSTLLLHEQQLKKQLLLEKEQPLTLTLINEHNIAYVDGTLIELKQATDHIVLAKVRVTAVHDLDVKPNQTLTIMYTGLLSDNQTPVIEQHYRWLIKRNDDKDLYYYIQGGLQGILKLD